MGKSASVFQFQLEGEFTGFTGGLESPFKYLRLRAAEQELQIKLAKELRFRVTEELIPGDRVLVSGEKKFKGSSGTLRLKAYHVDRLSCFLNPYLSENRPCLSKGKILFCHKSGCLKRGGKQVYEAIEQTLSQLGLQEQVTIERTGCQKRCKKAPNLIFMPGNVKYGSLSPNTVGSLVEQHFCN